MLLYCCLYFCFVLFLLLSLAYSRHCYHVVWLYPPPCCCIVVIICVVVHVVAIVVGCVPSSSSSSSSLSFVRHHPLVTLLPLLLLSRCIVVSCCFALFRVVSHCFVLLFLFLSMWLLRSYHIWFFVTLNLFPASGVISRFLIFFLLICWPFWWNNRSFRLHVQFHLFVLSRSYTALTHRTLFQLRRCTHAGDCHVVRCVWRFANWENVRFVGKTSEARVSRSYHNNSPVSRYC